MAEELKEGGAGSKASDEINGLQKVCILVFFDIPFLILLRSELGQFYLDYWCDVLESRVDRRLIFRISEQDLAEYLGRRKTLRQLILAPMGGFLYMVEGIAGESVAEGNVRRVRPEALEDDYVPGEDSLHDPSFIR